MLSVARHCLSRISFQSLLLLLSLFSCHRRDSPCFSRLAHATTTVPASTSSSSSSSTSIQVEPSSDSDSETTTTTTTIIGSHVEPHPDPNEEHYENMVYVGRHCHESGLRLSAQVDNSVKYIFGTSFDASHKEIEERDLLHHEAHTTEHDVADRGHSVSAPVTHGNNRENKNKATPLVHRPRHASLAEDGIPKAFGEVDTHPLDGGVTPVKVVSVEPFFLDTTLVTNKEFARFVKSTYYETEAEKYGWSFVLSSFVLDASKENEVDPEAEHWHAVEGAYWRQPEGPGSSYKHREHHPVVHISHRDAAEYCQWKGKRLPGEWEWEAAARAGHYGPSNRTLYAWGESDDWSTASQFANLWGNGSFPHENHAEDGWRGTSPVKHYPANALGFYDMTGNVWEWMRGGKHKARILRGGSYVDSLDGSSNHAATLGARSTVHATTTTGNVGFRCAKAPRKRTEYHYKWHDEESEGRLAVEDRFGKHHAVPQIGWEDRFDANAFEDDEFEYDSDVDGTEPRDGSSLKRKKVIKRVERLSTEL